MKKIRILLTEPLNVQLRANCYRFLDKRAICIDFRIIHSDAMSFIMKELAAIDFHIRDSCHKFHVIEPTTIYIPIKKSSYHIFSY